MLPQAAGAGRVLPLRGGAPGRAEGDGRPSKETERPELRPWSVVHRMGDGWAVQPPLARARKH